MHLEVLSNVAPSEWNKDVTALNGNCFHSYNWIQFNLENNKNANPLFFRLTDSSGKKHAIAFALLKTRSIAGKTIHRVLSFGSLPAAKSIDISDQMIQRIVEYSSKNNIVLLQVSAFGTPNANEILKKLGFSVQKRWEFVLQIDKSEDDIWENLDSKKRGHIRKARKYGLTVRSSMAMEDLMAYRDLAQETFERKTKQGIKYPEVPSLSYFESIKTHLLDNGIGKLYLAYNEKSVVAGALIAGFNKQAYYVLSSSSDIGLKKSAPDLIIWSSIVEYVKEGYSIFNLGGLAEDELGDSSLEEAGLYKFKKKYSADVIPGYSGKSILKPANYYLYRSVRTIKEKLKF